MPRPLELLFEAEGLPAFDLPEELERLYGPFGLSQPVLYAIFVLDLRLVKWSAPDHAAEEEHEATAVAAAAE